MTVTTTKPEQAEEAVPANTTAPSPVRPAVAAAPTKRKPGRPSKADREAREADELRAHAAATVKAFEEKMWPKHPAPPPPEPVAVEPAAVEPALPPFVVPESLPAPAPKKDKPMTDNKPDRPISEKELREDIASQDITVLTNDPDILAAWDRSNPLPLSKITLPDSELGLTPEQRAAARGRR